MNKKMVSLILILSFLGCKGKKYTIPDPPKEKPGILLVTKGLENENSKLIFDGYYDGQHNAYGYKIFKNGAYYILWPSDEELKWEKQKVLSEKELKRFTKIYRNYVLPYIEHPTQDPNVGRVALCYWYFYIDNERFIESYIESAGYSFFNGVKSPKMFNSKPKFAKKLEAFLEAHY